MAGRLTTAVPAKAGTASLVGVASDALGLNRADVRQPSGEM